MWFFDLFKPKRDPPKPKEPSVTINYTDLPPGIPDPLPKTRAKWKDRDTTSFSDCLELWGDIVAETSGKDISPERNQERSGFNGRRE